MTDFEINIQAGADHLATIRAMEYALNLPKNLDTIGGNPHAEPVARSYGDWRDDPGAWVEELRKSDVSSATIARSVRGVLEHYTEGSGHLPSDADLLLQLLQRLADRLGTRLAHDGEFFGFGGYYFPSCRESMTIIARLRDLAHLRIHGSELIRHVEPESPLSTVTQSLQALHEQHNPILTGAYNETGKVTGAGIELGLYFNSKMIAKLPRGKQAPGDLIQPELEGFEVQDGKDLIESCDMCYDGASGFLDAFGIGYERESETIECDQCGAEHENQDERPIEHVEPFTLDSAMVEHIEREGFDEAVRNYIGAGEASIEAWAESGTDEELIGKHEPSDQGIAFDTQAWDFEPDLAALPGVDDIDGAEAIRAGSLVQQIVQRHIDAGMLPPVPGKLTMRGAHRAELEWQPKHATLRARLDTHLTVEFYAARESSHACLYVRKPGEPRARQTWRLDSSTGSHIYMLRTAGVDAGSSVCRLLRIHQGRAEI